MSKATRLIVWAERERIKLEVESLISHLVQSSSSIDAGSCQDRRLDSAMEEVTLQCQTDDVDTLLRNVHGWLESHSAVKVQIVDSTGRVLLRVGPHPPKLQIDALQSPDSLSDSSFTMELRVARSRESSTKP